MLSPAFIGYVKKYLANSKTDKIFENLTITQDELFRTLSNELNLPLFKPDPVFLASISACLSSEVFDAVPLDVWKQNLSFPVETLSDTLKICAVDPFNLDWLKFLSFNLNKRVDAQLVSYSDLLEIYKALEPEYKFDQTNFEAQESSKTYRTTPNSESIAVKFLDQLLNESILKQVTDIHLIPTEQGAIVKTRICGDLIERIRIPHKLLRAVANRLKSLTHLDIANPLQAQDGSLRYENGLTSRDLRLSFIPTEYGESIVIRILGSEKRVFSLDELGLASHEIQLIRRQLKLQAGLIVVSGPTGSGKTTTLYAMLNELNSGTRKIITIEDPVEYRFEGISQFQVNEKNGLTFSELLKRVLRHDPDIIMVGEIRDHETASLCIQAAQTGHMVLGTIHAKSCGGVVTRFLNLGVTNKDLASSLSLIISQRLVKSRDNRRLGVFSIMPITVRLADLIAKGVSEHELELAAFDDGFISLYKKAKILEKEGLIQRQESEKLKDDKFVVNDGPVGRKINILLVEDNEETLCVLKRMLENRFFEVVDAKNGLEALEKIQIKKPDLILSDIMMPLMSGTDLVKKIRSNPLTSHIPVIMLTAVDTDEQELKSLELGADDFISKMDDPQIILARIERLVNRHCY